MFHINLSQRRKEKFLYYNKEGKKVSRKVRRERKEKFLYYNKEGKKVSRKDAKPAKKLVISIIVISISVKLKGSRIRGPKKIQIYPLTN